MEAVEKSGSIGDLEVLLKHEVVAAMAGEQAESVRRSVQYAEGVIRQGETLLTGWPVLAVNEWGVQQERVLQNRMDAVAVHEFQRQLHASNRLQQLCSNPLMLSMLISIFKSNQSQLPTKPNSYMPRP